VEPTLRPEQPDDNNPAAERSAPSKQGLPPLGPISTLSIVIPTYNERATIGEILRRVTAANTPLEKELVIVDDCSRDGTRELLQTLEQSIRRSNTARVKLIFHEENQGKGAAVRTGIYQASGELIVIQDADLEYDPQDYAQLLQPIMSGDADVVFGNRFHGGPHRVLYFWHFQANRFLTLLTNLLTDLNLSDMEVGYKVFRRDIFDRIRLRSNRFGFEPEVTVKVAMLKCRIYEVPISYHGRTYEEGKKIGWKDGVAALFHLFRARFFH
jgi:glycosyltransferase involved in cell wall biosynthesis